MSVALYALSGVGLAAWLYLLLFNGGFWRADQLLPRDRPALERWPHITAVIPARNELPTIGATVESLLRQDYPGRLEIVLVDDRSDDGTAAAARAAALRAQAAERLTVVSGAELPAGWVGKMWAVHQGLQQVPPDADYVLLTDADITHDAANLRRLATHAETGRLDLVSLMVRLHCASAAEYLLIPAFVFFFQMLYPFPRVNDPRSKIAAAAGGCMLVRRTALERAGGIAAIRHTLIDDCALARNIKSGGVIWLGLTTSTFSTRAYAGIGEIWRMVARTAYTQLNYSPWLLAGTVVGMALVFAAPVVGLVGALALQLWPAAAIGAAAIALMTLCFYPTWRLYARTRLELFLLPLAGCLYTLMTIDSARRHWTGQGGAWKGRAYAPSTTRRPPP
ncbi:MAG: glycosyltransferase [Alphaproteobacteria bacterium]